MPAPISEERYHDDNNRKFNLIEINEPSELINWLHLSNPVWKSSSGSGVDSEWIRGWYFRGQGDAEWDLVPSAWRKSKPEQRRSVIEIGHEQYNFVRVQSQNSIKRLRSGESRSGSVSWQTVDYVTRQIAVELSIVREFIEFADSVGHPVPESKIPPINYSFIYGLMKDLVNGTREVLDPEIWSDKAILLAQHHGVPTRLLDWTRHALTAAYFAARDAIAKPPESGFFAVYAIHTLHLNRRNVFEVRGRSGENTYLAAQQGVLTVDRNAEQFYLTHLRYPDLMSSLFNLGEYPLNPYRPYKFVVPLDLAHDLIRQLFLERVTRAHLMPTLDNVAQTIMDKWHFVLTPPPDEDVELTSGENKAANGDEQTN